MLNKCMKMINLDFIKQHKKKICIAIIIICIALIGAFVYFDKQKPQIATIEDTTPSSVFVGMSNLGISTDFKMATKVSEEIVEREKQPADTTWKSNTQAQSDAKAKDIAKADKADGVLKKTETVDGQIENKYYAIHLEKNNAIGVGVTVVDGKFYIAAGYERTINTNKNISIEVIAHSKDIKNIDGVTALVKKKF